MEGPHKQGYVMTGNSQHEVGVPIFNSEVQKYILIKLTIHLFPPLCLPPLFLPSIVSFPLVYKQAVNSSNLKNNKNKISIIYNPLQYFLAPFCSKTPQRSSLSILLSMSLYTHFLPFLKSMDLLSDYTHLTVISSSSMTLN